MRFSLDTPSPPDMVLLLPCKPLTFGILIQAQVLQANSAYWMQTQKSFGTAIPLAAFTLKRRVEIHKAFSDFEMRLKDEMEFISSLKGFRTCNLSAFLLIFSSYSTNILAYKS